MPTRNLTVQFDSDVSGLDRGIGTAIARLQRLGATFSAIGQNGNRFFGGLSSGSQGATTSLQRAQTALGRLQDQIQNTSFRGLRVPPEIMAQYRTLSQRIEAARSATNAPVTRTSGFNSAIGSVAGLATGYLSLGAAINGVQQALNITSDFQRIDSVLKAVSTSSVDYARSQSFLRTQSDQLGISYEALAGSYGQLKAATSGTNLEGKETERIFGAVVRAGATLKLSNDDVRGSLRALTQMISTGTVQSDELKNELGNRLPGALKLMANALGVSQKELAKMLEQGQVMAEDALPKLATELEKTFGAGAQSNVQTMAGGFTRATDQLKLFVAEFNQAAGVDSFFTRIGNGFADTLQGIREAVRSKEWLTFFGALTKLSFLPSLPGNTERLGQLANNSRVKDEFGGQDSSMRQARMGVLEDTIARLEGELAKRKDTVIGGGKAQIESELANARKLLGELVTINGKLRREERSATSTATGGGANGGGGSAIDAAKKKLSALKESIESILVSGGAVPAAMQREYDTLAAKIDKATGATKRNTTATKSLNDSRFGALNAYKLIEANLEREIQNLGQAAPKKLLDQLDAIRGKITDIKDSTGEGRGVDLGNIKPISPIGDIASVVANVRAPQGPQLPGLAGFMAGQKEASDQALAQLAADKKALKDSLDEIPGIFSFVRNGLQSLANGDPFNSKGLMTKVGELGKNFKQTLSSVKVAIVGGTLDALAGFGEAIGMGMNVLDAGKKALRDILKGIINLIADQVIQIGKALILVGVPMLFTPATAALGLKNIGAGTAIVIAGGLAKGLAATALESGGLATGTTFAMIGETAKARAGGGEYVASVELGSKLIAKNILRLGALEQPDTRSSDARVMGIVDRAMQRQSQQPAYVVQQFGDQGGFNFDLRTSLKSDEIELILERGKRNKGRV